MTFRSCFYFLEKPLRGIHSIKGTLNSVYAIAQKILTRSLVFVCVCSTNLNKWPLFFFKKRTRRKNATLYIMSQQGSHAELMV